jgi:hypothetical protein
MYMYEYIFIYIYIYICIGVGKVQGGLEEQLTVEEANVLTSFLINEIHDPASGDIDLEGHQGTCSFSVFPRVGSHDTMLVPS